MSGRTKLRAKMGVIAALMACASAGCDPASAVAIELSCAVENAQMLSTSEEICAVFHKKLESALSEPVSLSADYAQHGQGDAIGVSVRILKRGSIVATVKQRIKGTERDFPETSIDVMDRPLSIGDVALLADEVARMIMQKPR